MNSKSSFLEYTVVLIIIVSCVNSNSQLNFASQTSGLCPFGKDVRDVIDVTSSTNEYILKSPNYPQNYPLNSDCWWRFRTLNGSRLRVTFRSFSTEENYDFLTFFDGASTDAKNFSFSGHFNFGPAIVTDSNEMIVRFTSDNSGGYSGFVIQIQETLNAANFPPFAPGVHSTLCSNNPEVIVHDGTTSLSYFYPESGYPDLSECYWSIRAHDLAPENARIKITFTFFETEHSFDIAYIYGDWTENYRIAVISGVQTGFSLVSGNDRMLLNFHSDGSANFKGFRASLSLVTGEINAIQTLPTAHSGAIVSPYFPEIVSTPAMNQWQWTMCITTGSELWLFTRYINLATSDYIKVYSGRQISENQLRYTMHGYFTTSSMIIHDTCVTVTYIKGSFTPDSHQSFALQYFDSTTQSNPPPIDVDYNYTGFSWWLSSVYALIGFSVGAIVVAIMHFYRRRATIRHRIIGGSAVRQEHSLDMRQQGFAATRPPLPPVYFAPNQYPTTNLVNYDGPPPIYSNIIHTPPTNEALTQPTAFVNPNLTAQSEPGFKQLYLEQKL